MKKPSKRRAFSLNHRLIKMKKLIISSHHIPVIQERGAVFTAVYLRGGFN